MKRTFFLVITALAALSCSVRPSKQGTARETSAQQAEMTESAEELSEYVHVSHKWMEIDLSRFIGVPPTEEEIDQWKTEFEYVNPVDSVWRTELNYYRSEAHYMAVNDLIELIHGPRREESFIDYRKIVWRLLQFDPNPARMSADGFGKVRYFRTLYEDLLDYFRVSQMDMNLGACLDADMRIYYLIILHLETFAHFDEPTKSRFKQEEELMSDYNEAARNLYTRIDGSPDGWNGSSYPYRVAMFDVLVLDGEIKACEAFFEAITNDVKLDIKTGISTKHVENEYNVFASSFVEDEYGGYSVEERKAALDKDRKAWNRWMASRDEVSGHLNGNAKIAFDTATRELQRYKLIMLKNRYEKDDAFCSNYIAKHLLSYENSTDEEIFAHNLEALLEKELK